RPALVVMRHAVASAHANQFDIRTSGNRKPSLAVIIHDARNGSADNIFSPGVRHWNASCGNELALSTLKRWRIACADYGSAGQSSFRVPRYWRRANPTAITATTATTVMAPMAPVHMDMDHTAA